MPVFSLELAWTHRYSVLPAEQLGVEDLMLPGAENLLGSAVHLYFLSWEVRQDQQRMALEEEELLFISVGLLCNYLWSAAFRALTKIH